MEAEKSALHKRNICGKSHILFKCKSWGGSSQKQKFLLFRICLCSYNIGTCLISIRLSYIERLYESLLSIKCSLWLYTSEKTYYFSISSSRYSYANFQNENSLNTRNIHIQMILFLKIILFIDFCPCWVIVAARAFL